VDARLGGLRISGIRSPGVDGQYWKGSWEMLSLWPGWLVGARLAIAALVSTTLLAPGPANVRPVAHPMAPAVGSSVQFDTAGDLIPSGLTRFPCQSAASPSPCYGPDQLRAAYDVQALLDRGITGAGRTIVIIDAFQDPLLQSDMDHFNQIWSLPATTVEVTAPDGLAPFDATSSLQRSWAIEIAVDVEWAHVIAPGARLHLVLAKSEQDADVLSATKYAIRHNLGDVISQSFGEAESCQSAEFLAQQHEIFREAVEKGITLVAASGDVGAAQHTCDGTLVAGVATPASDPAVTAVGGTRLVADPVSGVYGSEVGWGDQVGASGGGFSTLYRRPGYQAPLVEGKMRGLPDVAWSSDLYGAAIALALGGAGRTVGTSAATAEWAGIAALADQQSGHRLGSLNTWLYHVGKGRHYTQVMHDVTSGNNTFKGFTGFSAGPGWDPVTGLGTPDVAKLVSLLRDGEED
jgi:subtilase family serine protease